MAGRELPPSSPFASDDGSADPGVAAALAAYGTGEGSLAGVVAALAGTRVLVPVLAELELADVVVHDGHEHTVDKEASAGIVALQTPDGRRALPAFTSVSTMTAWRADARPVPTGVARAALSAVQEGWEVVVVDPGGPVTALLPRPAVWALAKQEEWVPAVDGGAVAGDVAAAVARALDGVPAVVRADVEPGRRAELAVVATLVAGLDRPALERTVAGINAALAAEEVVAERVDSLELRLRSAS
ncbi:SseB family protein [Cellulomonas palmilytica]|uniref:SseB family protein n=1 Tax=Cellulomonas palmilytica TaxID=2608402 RepID=UPI001F3A4542|nr:SseB family protein [Cellulomonas palmilytica]UJP38791.1 SseB family protein [Cellulomonas palmilytica]